MALFTLITLVVGLVLSSVSGLACYMGPGALASHVSGIPGFDLVLSYPAATLAVGSFVTIISAFGQPSRVE